MCVCVCVSNETICSPLPETVPNEPSVTKTVRSKVDDDKPTPRKEQQLPKPVYHGQVNHYEIVVSVSCGLDNIKDSFQLQIADML